MRALYVEPRGLSETRWRVKWRRECAAPAVIGLRAGTSRFARGLSSQSRGRREVETALGRCEMGSLNTQANSIDVPIAHTMPSESRYVSNG